MNSQAENSRVVRLDGGRNFRDIGGYATADGRRVKWATVFRSGALSALSDADYSRLDVLGIRIVFDLRSTRERASERFRNAGARPIQHHTWDYESDSRELVTRLKESRDDVERIRGVIFDIYRALPWEFADRYRAIIEHLLAGETPMVFNCAAGKDRTGVGAALLLAALGVPRAAILEDYALTEKLLDIDKIVRESHNDEASGYHFLHGLPEPARSLLLRSDPAYLDAMFESIEARCGSVMSFLEQFLGLDDRALANLRDHLLE